MRAIFVRTLNIQTYFENVESFSLKLNMANRRHFFSALNPETCWYSLLSCPISFNLIWGFRYLQFETERATSLVRETPLKVNY